MSKQIKVNVYFAGENNGNAVELADDFYGWLSDLKDSKDITEFTVEIVVPEKEEPTMSDTVEPELADTEDASPYENNPLYTAYELLVAHMQRATDDNARIIELLDEIAENTSWMLPEEEVSDEDDDYYD
jgi:hypothetical protein